MPRLRYVGATPYHGTGGKWLPGVDLDVEASRASWLLEHFPDLFVPVGAEASPPAPSPPPAEVPATEPERRTKPARFRRKA